MNQPVKIWALRKSRPRAGYWLLNPLNQAKDGLMNLVSSLQDCLQVFSSEMTKPTFRNLLPVLFGWLFSSRHTIAAAIHASGHAGSRHHSAFYRTISCRPFVSSRSEQVNFCNVESTKPVDFMFSSSCFSREFVIISPIERFLVDWFHSNVLVTV